jgi:hypothetical protein
MLYEYVSHCRYVTRKDKAQRWDEMYCGGLKQTLELRTELLLGYYTASSGDVLQTFWDNLSVPSSEVKNKKWGR